VMLAVVDLLSQQTNELVIVDAPMDVGEGSNLAVGDDGEGDVAVVLEGVEQRSQLGGVVCPDDTEED
ncbi:MAG: hypothetical protein Q9Q40_09640, partial [Acidobacteriota bacterium]|nr:hypothetical protein [Acidobacteriota bacterium]